MSNHFHDIKMAFAREAHSVNEAHELCMKEQKELSEKLTNYQITLEQFESGLAEIKAKRDASWKLARERNTCSV